MSLTNLTIGGAPPVGVGSTGALPPRPPAAPEPGTGAPTATTTLSPEAAQARVSNAYEMWNTSIENGVKNADPEARNAARGVLGLSLKQTQEQSEVARAAGKPYDMDAGLAANMANNSATILLGGQNSPDPNAQSTRTLAEMNTTAMNYLEARKAQVQAEINASGGGGR